MPKILIDKDPYREQDTLPWEEDFSKHYYNTLAVLHEGRHAGKVGLFSRTTIKSNEIPYFMFLPTFDSDNSLSLVPVSKVRYSSLSNRHPFPVGWYQGRGDALVGVTHNQKKQWKVGCHTNNTHLFVLNKLGHAAIPLAEKLTLENFGASGLRHPIELAAQVNSFGYPQYPESVEEADAVFKARKKNVPIILGRLTALCNDVFYTLGVATPIGVVVEEEVLVTSNAAARIISSTVAAPCSVVSQTKFKEAMSEKFGKLKKTLNKEPSPYESIMKSYVFSSDEVAQTFNPTPTPKFIASEDGFFEFLEENM